METECNTAYLDFPMVGRRELVAGFDGGDITSDGGALLLRKVEQLTGVIRQFAACFADFRNPRLIEHTVEELVAQRVYALALGYEDLVDHDDLRRDPLLAAVVGKDDPKGTTAYVFDEEADVLFMVNLMSENKAAAQKLVETLAKKP